MSRHGDAHTHTHTHTRMHTSCINKTSHLVNNLHFHTALLDLSHSILIPIPRSTERQLLLFDINDLSKPKGEAILEVSPSTLIPHFDKDTNVLFLAGKGDRSVYAYEFIPGKWTHSGSVLTAMCACLPFNILFLLHHSCLPPPSPSWPVVYYSMFLQSTAWNDIAWPHETNSVLPPTTPTSPQLPPPPPNYPHLPPTPPPTPTYPQLPPTTPNYPHLPPTTPTSPQVPPPPPNYPHLPPTPPTTPTTPTYPHLPPPTPNYPHLPPPTPQTRHPISTKFPVSMSPIPIRQ